MTTRQIEVRSARIARVVLLAVALLLAAATAYILFEPVSASDFESTTGIGWATFSAANPDVADYLSREARLLAVGWLGLSLLVAALVWRLPRSEDGRAPAALWLYPIMLVGAALVFIGGGGPVLGGTYLAAGVVAGAALIALRPWNRGA